MAVFQRYAEYYDLLYRDKNYSKEVDYIDQLIKKYHPGSKTILDLGCGTGRHALYLAKKGYEVTGVDRSDDMLSIARNHSRSFNSNSNPSLAFQYGDIRTVRLNRHFDVVVSLFHVISYLPSNEDVLEALNTVKIHLNQGGIFIFDCWYGPGVLTDPPVVRKKESENENMYISRIAQPVSAPNENIVDVRYHISVYDKVTKKEEEIIEVHRMRYFFRPEIDLFLNQCDLALKKWMKFLSEDEPTQMDWNVCFLCQRI